MNRRECNSRVRTEKEFGLIMFVRRCDVGNRLGPLFHVPIERTHNCGVRLVGLHRRNQKLDDKSFTCNALCFDERALLARPP